jgi:8-oxo-dGTP pyrophosphatase MutT (NUDIX family)
MTHKRIAAGLFLTDGDKVLLLKRSKKESHSGSWGIPGGKGEDSENYLECAKRETKEETGRLPEFKVLGYIDEPITNGTFRTFICKVTDLYRVKVSSEHSEYGWIKLKEVKKMDVHPSIKKNFSKILSILADNNVKITENLLEMADHSGSARVRGEAQKVFQKIGIVSPSQQLIDDMCSLIAIIHPTVGMPGTAFFKLWKDVCDEIHNYVYQNHGEYNSPEDNRILNKAGDPHSLWHTLKEMWGSFNDKAMLEDENTLKGRDLFLKRNADYKKQTYRYGDKRKTPSVWNRDKKIEDKKTENKKSVIEILKLFKDCLKNLKIPAIKDLAKNIAKNGNLLEPSTEEMISFYKELYSIPPEEKPDTTPPTSSKIPPGATIV